MEDEFIKYDRAIKALELVDGAHWKSLVYGETDVNRNKDDLNGPKAEIEKEARSVERKEKL